MKNIRYIMVLLLLNAATMSSLAQQTVSADHGSRPTAGCHEHGKPAPVRPRGDFACCLAGHSFAVVPASVHLQPALPLALNRVPETGLQTSPMVREIIAPPLLLVFPAGSLPLRV